MEYIKQALWNPLTIMENIMGVGFPNEAYPYLNMLYTTFGKLIFSLLPYKRFESSLDFILEHHKITPELLNKLDHIHFKLDGVMQIIDIIKSDLLFSYIHIASKIQDGSDVEDHALEYRRLINCLSLNPDAIYPELRGQNMFFSDKSLMDLSIWLTESIMTIAHNALNHNNQDKFGRIYMYVPDSEKPKATQFKRDDYDRLYILVDDRDKIRMNVRAKEERKFANQQLRKEVNKLDKEAGCDLEHPVPPVDTPHKFEMKVNKYKYQLAKYLFKLNNMKLKKHLDENTIFGMEVHNIEINKKFKKMSPWFDKEEVEMDEQKFMIRFISFLFAWVIRHLTEVAEICYAINKDHESIEFESKMDYVKYTVKRAMELADKIMNGENVEDDLIYFEQLMMYMESSPKTKKKVLKNAENLKENAEILRVDLQPFPNFPMYSQDILMDTMVKLGYMITTHDKKMKAGLEFHERYKFRKRGETKIILEELGKAVHRSHKKTPTPPMFRYFVEADPIVESQFEDVNENQNLATGVMALKYLAFIINDPNVKARIESII